MIKETKILGIMGVALLSGCSSSVNPLLDKEFDTPFNLPPFEQIQNNNYVPAFEAAIRGSKTRRADIR